jgi:hypothetical protein
MRPVARGAAVGVTQRQAVEELMGALLNTAEFVFKD